MNKSHNTRHFFRQGIGIAGSALLPEAQRCSQRLRRSSGSSRLSMERFRYNNRIGIGFDSAAADAFTAVGLADAHYGVGEAGEMLPPLFAEFRRTMAPTSLAGTE
jgi:hypothetical protein